MAWDSWLLFFLTVVGYSRSGDCQCVYVSGILRENMLKTLKHIATLYSLVYMVDDGLLSRL